MRTLAKRTFGLITIVVGLAALVFGVGQTWLNPEVPFQVGPFFGGLLWGWLGFTYGLKWLLNRIDMDVFPVAQGSPEIQDAVGQAQATLGTLWYHLGQNRHECFIKFAIETRGGKEHIWGIVHSRVEDQVVVSPMRRAAPPLTNHGERFMVPVGDIEDWQVPVSPTEIRGGYSVAALAKVARAHGYTFSKADRRKLGAFVDAAPAP